MAAVVVCSETGLWKVEDTQISSIPHFQIGHPHPKTAGGEALPQSLEMNAFSLVSLCSQNRDKHQNRPEGKME